MKKVILYSLVSSGILLLAGCNEEWNVGKGTQGSFNPIVTLDTDPVNSRADLTEGRSGEITANDLKLTLTSHTGVTRTWNSVSEFDPQEKFNVGTYTLEATYGDKSEEGFEKPHFYGATQFTVRENETTPVALTAAYGNAMVSVGYTEAFTGYFTSYSVDVETLAGTVISHQAGETRPSFVAPGSVKIVANVTKPSGVQGSYQATSFVAEAAHHYHLTLDVNEGNVGSAFLTISFDDSMDMEDVVIDLSKDLTNTPAPTVSTEGFAGGDSFNVVVGAEPSTPLEMTIMARGGLASVMLETTSTSLIKQGWPESVDLVAVPADVQARMTELGFKEIGLWNNPDCMGVVDLTAVISHIAYVVGTDNLSTFTLTVTDRLQQSSEPVSFNIVIEKLSLEIANPSALMEEATEMSLDVEYNGKDINDVTMQYKNERGTWTNLKMTGAELKSRTSSTYRVSVSGLPADDADVTLRAVVLDGTEVVAETLVLMTVERGKVPYSLACDENDIFATHGLLTVVSDSESAAEVAKLAKLMLSTDGGASFSEYTTTVDGANLSVSGLEPGTQYTARIEVDGVAGRKIDFMTEAATQLPNGDMEQWDSNRQTNHTVYYPWSNGAEQLWNTYNPVTTSQSGAGYAYIITSGTIQTSDCHGGSSAAQVRTVGWGSGNKASSSTGNWQFGGTIFGKWECKHISAGQLFLGNWDGISATQDATPNYGLDFTSRPASMTFWYKYAQMSRNAVENGQKGVAEIRILDNAGNVVSEQIAYLEKNAAYSNLDDASDSRVGGQYAEFTVNLNYPANSAKAAKIQVIFRSTQFTTAELEAAKNQDNLRPPKGMNLSNHENLGSSLFIDDITLNY